MKNKILTISIIFILLTFCFISNVFAYTETFTNNDINYSFYLPDSNYNKLLELEEYKSGDYYYFVFINYGVHVYFLPKDMGLKVRIDTSTIGTYDCYFYFNSILSLDDMIYYTMSENGDGSDLTLITSLSSFKSSFFTKGNTLYMYTNMNVYSDSTYTDFFFETPVTEQPTEELTLAGIMNKAGEQATAEVTKIILIVIITTVGLIVLLIGLKKGLMVLMSGFRH